MNSRKIAQGLVWGIYALVGIIPLIFYVQTMFPYATIKIALFQGMVELMIALWVCLVIVAPEYRPKKSPLLIASGVYLVILILASFFGVDVLRSLWSTVDRLIGIVFLTHIFMFFVMMQSLGREINWRILFSISVVASAIVSLGAVLQRYGLEGILSKTGDRPGSTFGNAAFMGGYVLINIFIALWLWAMSRNKKLKLLYALAIILGVAGIFIGQTIAVLVGFAVAVFLALALLAFRIEHPMGRIIVRMIVLTGVCFALIFVFTRSASFWQKIPGVARVAAISLKSSDVSDRFIAWRIALQSFGERPWLGWGWDNFYVPFNAHYDPHLLLLSGKGDIGTAFDKPHNVVLEQLVVAGIPGILSYLFIIVAFGYELKRINVREDTYFKIFFGAAAIAYFIQNLTIFDTIGTYLMMAIVLAFIDTLFLYSRESGRVGMPTVTSEKKVSGPAIGVAVVIALIPLYMLNIQTLRGLTQYYWGVNYFVHVLPKESMQAWERAASISYPYADYARKDFASTLGQGLRQGIVFPDIDQRAALAIRGLREAEKDYPRDYNFPLVLADLYNNLYLHVMQLPDYSSLAIEEGNKALALSPKRQQTYYLLAQSYLLTGKTKEAIALIEQAVVAEPLAGEPHFFYALLAYQVGDVKRGDSELALAYQYGRRPASIKEYIDLASLLGDVKHDYAAAIPLLNNAIAMALNDNQTALAADTELKLGVAYYFNGDMKDAKETFTDVSKKANLRALPIWSSLAPVFQELGVKVP